MTIWLYRVGMFVLGMAGGRLLVHKDWLGIVSIVVAGALFTGYMTYGQSNDSHQ